MSDQLNVQFKDATKQIIVAYFGAPQSADVYPNCGVVTADDPKWSTFYESQPPGTQQGLPQPVVAG